MRRGYPKVWPDNKKTSLTTYCQGSCMPMMGLEPIRCCHRQILSLLRLPIPPHRLKCVFNNATIES